MTVKNATPPILLGCKPRKDSANSGVSACHQVVSDSSVDRAALTCAKEPYESLRLPSAAEPPYFTPLRCSLQPREREQRDRTFTEYYPFSVTKCDKCGWAAIVPEDCPFHFSDAPCTWFEQQDVDGENIFLEKTGTRRELMGKIKALAEPWLYHM